MKNSIIRNFLLPVVAGGFFAICFLYYLIFDLYLIAYQEQIQLFRFDPHYFADFLLNPGGPADMMRWTRDDGQNGTVPGTTPGSYLEQKFGSGLNAKPVLMRYGDNATLKDQSLRFPKNLLFSIPQPELDRNKKCVNNPDW